MSFTSFSTMMLSFSTLSLMSTRPGEPLYRALGFVPDAGVDYPLPDGTTLPLIPMTKVMA